MRRYFVSRDGQCLIAEALEFEGYPPSEWRASTIHDPNAGIISFTLSEAISADTDGTLAVIGEEGVAWVVEPTAIAVESGQPVRMEAIYRGERLDSEDFKVIATAAVQAHIASL